ncbi:TPA: hypothetical protein HA325_04190, partial [Candidatus Thalassarchaeaceae archaeon]
MSLDRDALSAMKVSELRELCKENGLFVSGKKTDLIDRLLGEESVSPIAKPSKKLPTSDEGRGDAIDRLLARVESGGGGMPDSEPEINEDSEPDVLEAEVFEADIVEAEIEAPPAPQEVLAVEPEVILDTIILEEETPALILEEEDEDPWTDGVLAEEGATTL